MAATTKAVTIPFSVTGVDKVLGAFRTIKNALKSIEESKHLKIEIGPELTAAADKAAQASARRKRATEEESAATRALAEAIKQANRERIAAERETNRLNRVIENSSANIARKRLQASANAAKAEHDLKLRYEQDLQIGVRRLRRQALREQLAEQKEALRQSEIEARRSDRQALSMQRRDSHVIGSSIRQSVGTVTRLAGAALALGGGFTSYDAVQGELTSRGAARHFAIQSGAYSADPTARANSVSDAVVQGLAKSIAVEYGYKQEDILGALSALYEKSGSVTSARSLLPFVVKMSRAFGTNLGDVASMAGMAEFTNKDVNRTMRDMMTLAVQGRVGAIDPQELRTYGTRVFAAAQQYADPSKAVEQLGTIMQMSRGAGGAVSAAEASMGVMRLTSNMSVHADDFESGKFGFQISVWKDKYRKVLREPLEFLKDLLTQLEVQDAVHRRKKGFEVLPEAAFLRKEFGLMGERGAEGLAVPLHKFMAEVRAEREAQVTAGRRKAPVSGDEIADSDMSMAKEAWRRLEESMRPMREAATSYSKDQLAKEAMARVDAADLQIAKVYEQLRIAVGENLVPVLVALGPKLQAAIPRIVGALESVVHAGERVARALDESPLTTIGTLIAAKIGADLVAARIGDVIASGISGAYAGRGIAGGAAGVAAAADIAGSAGATGRGRGLGPLVLPTTLGGVAATAGAAAVIAATAYTGYVVGQEGIDHYMKGLAKDESSRVGAATQAVVNSGRIRRMPAGKDRDEAFRKNADALASVRTKIEVEMSEHSLGNMIVADFDPEAAKTKYDAQLRTLQSIVEAQRENDAWQNSNRSLRGKARAGREQRIKDAGTPLAAMLEEQEGSLASQFPVYDSPFPKSKGTPTYSGGMLGDFSAFVSRTVLEVQDVVDRSRKDPNRFSPYATPSSDWSTPDGKVNFAPLRLAPFGPAAAAQGSDGKDHGMAQAASVIRDATDANTGVTLLNSEAVGGLTESIGALTRKLDDVKGLGGAGTVAPTGTPPTPSNAGRAPGKQGSPLSTPANANYTPGG